MKRPNPMTVADIKEMISGLEDSDTVVLVREKQYVPPLAKIAGQFIPYVREEYVIEEHWRHAGRASCA